MSQYVADDDVATIAYMMGVESGKDYERARIVAWLRADLRDTFTAGDLIEAGEHLK